MTRTQSQGESDSARRQLTRSPVLSHDVVSITSLVPTYISLRRSIIVNHNNSLQTMEIKRESNDVAADQRASQTMARSGRRRSDYLRADNRRLLPEQPDRVRREGGRRIGIRMSGRMISGRKGLESWGTVRHRSWRDERLPVENPAWMRRFIHFGMRTTESILFIEKAGAMNIFKKRLCVCFCYSFQWTCRDHVTRFCDSRLEEEAIGHAMCLQEGEKRLVGTT